MFGPGVFAISGFKLRPRLARPAGKLLRKAVGLAGRDVQRATDGTGAGEASLGSTTQCQREECAKRVGLSDRQSSTEHVSRHVAGVAKIFWTYYVCVCP